MRKKYPPDPIIAAIEEGRCLPYKEVIMKPGWVSDVMQEEVETWDSIPIGLKPPVLINAPTGLGKNTFVKNVLAEYAERKNDYVLLLTNRYTLNLQQKQGFSDSSNHPPFGTAMIDGVRVFGYIIALLYHEVPYHLKQIIAQYRIRYVVFDEVHFFCSDATFNVETCNIFRMILRTCPYTKRIYMSATPEDVKSLIAYEEYNLYWALRASSGPSQLSAMVSSGGYGITEYCFPRNYSFVDLHFFVKWDEIEGLINSQESNEKWLIFVSSKEVGADLKKKIRGSEFIDATYKDLHPEKIQRMARLRKFNERILIATTVLYNGFSIDDDDLKNIVVDSANRVEVLQMLGRKRLTENQAVKLYVMEKGEEVIESLKNSYIEDYQLLQEFTNDRIRFNQNRLGTLTEGQQHLFTIDQGYVACMNPHVPYQLACLSGKYERLEDRFSREGDMAFFNEVCSWFSIQYESDMGESLHDRIKKWVIDFTEQHINQPMNEDDFAAFSEQFMAIVDPLVSKMNQAKKNAIRNEAGRSLSNINHTYEFFALSYICKKANNIWTISKAAHSSNNLTNDEDDTEK